MTVQGRGRPPRADRDATRGISSYRATGPQVRSGNYRPRRSASTWRGLLVLGILAAVVVGGAIMFAGPALQGFARGMARDNPQTMRWPFVGDVVRADLGAALQRPAGTDETPVEMTIAEGATVSQIARELASQGLVSDALVFQYLVVTEDLESELQTGTFSLNETMTPQQIVDRLQLPPDPPPARVSLAVREGLRIEQYVAQLQDQQPAEIDPAEFHELAIDPPAALRADYPWMRVIPQGRSLEGFLGAGVFEMDAETDAEALLRMLLDDWEASIGDVHLAQAEEDGRDFYEVMTLASIVEKETGLDAERALIAGVYQNRLDGKLNGNELLNADPTVVYARDTIELRKMPITQWPSYAFWGLIGVASLNEFDVPEDLQGYQTYQVQGLPPGPIASPTPRSVEAVLRPDTESGYVFFVGCGEGAHRFAKTPKEHTQNVAECQG